MSFGKGRVGASLGALAADLPHVTITSTRDVFLEESLYKGVKGVSAFA